MLDIIIKVYYIHINFITYDMLNIVIITIYSYIISYFIRADIITNRLTHSISL